MNERNEWSDMEKRWKQRWAVLLMLCLILSVLGAAVPERAAAVQKGTVTATSLYVREGPSTSYDKVQVNGSDVYLRNGETVELLSETDGWYYIETTFYGTDVEGYICGDYLEIEGGISDPQEDGLELPALVTGEGVNIRTGAGTSYESLGMLNREAEVVIRGLTDADDTRWYLVDAVLDGTETTGYMSSDYVELDLEEPVQGSIVPESARPRQGAGETRAYVKNVNTIVALEQGASVTMTEELPVD